MDRPEFEALRDLPGKVIRQDIKFSRRDALRPALSAEGISIENASGVELSLTITWNPEHNGKTFNVHAKGVGAICRLDVDSTPHRPCGRSHKHSLRTPQCPQRNLRREVVDRSDLAGQSLAQVFAGFCAMANITYEGEFVAPD